MLYHGLFINSSTPEQLQRHWAMARQKILSLSSAGLRVVQAREHGWGGRNKIFLVFFQKPDIPVLEVFCLLSRLSVTDIIGITRTDRGSYRSKSCHSKSVSVSLGIKFVMAYV